MTEIFISYSSKDNEKVGRLVKELKSKGAKLWFDDEQILPGDDLIEKMSEGISGCKYYIMGFFATEPEILPSERRMNILTIRGS